MIEILKKIVLIFILTVSMSTTTISPAYAEEGNVNFELYQDIAIYLIIFGGIPVILRIMSKNMMKDWLKSGGRNPWKYYDNGENNDNKSAI